MSLPHPHDPDQPDDIPSQLSAMRAQLSAMRADLDALSDDRRGIVSQLASLVVDVSRLTRAASVRLPESDQEGGAA